MLWCRSMDDPRGLGYRSLDEHDFVIVNPLQVPAPYWQHLPVMTLTPKPLKDQSHLAPVLLDLRQMDKDARIALLMCSETWDRDHDTPYFSALLVADVSHRQLASHLRSQTIVRSPSTGQSWLRFHDPRVFQHLRWVLSAAQMDDLLGPVSIWTWRDQEGKWQTHSRDGAPGTASAALTPQQWDTMSRIGILNRTLLQLSRKISAFVADDAMAQRVEKLLSESFVLHGLRDESDRRLYAEQIIRIHPLVHRHPDLVSRLAQARTGECTYVGACSNLDDEEIRRITLDLECRSTRTHA